MRGLPSGFTGLKLFPKPLFCLTGCFGLIHSVEMAGYEFPGGNRARTTQIGPLTTTETGESCRPARIGETSMMRRLRRAVVMCAVVLGTVGSATESQACGLFGWLF